MPGSLSLDQPLLLKLVPCQSCSVHVTAHMRVTQTQSVAPSCACGRRGLLGRFRGSAGLCQHKFMLVNLTLSCLSPSNGVFPPL